MNPNIAVIVDRMKNGNYRQRDEFVSVQMADLAEVMALVAEDQTASAEKLDKQTDKLISLTRWLVGLTVALFILTVYLCYDAFEKSVAADARPDKCAVSSQK